MVKSNFDQLFIAKYIVNKINKNIDSMSESDIRKYVREVLVQRLGGGNSEILSPDKKMKNETAKLRSCLVDLLKNLDVLDDSIIDKCNKAIDFLVKWQTEVSKVI